MAKLLIIFETAISSGRHAPHKERKQPKGVLRKCERILTRIWIPDKNVLSLFQREREMDSAGSISRFFSARTRLRHHGSGFSVLTFRFSVSTSVFPKA